MTDQPNSIRETEFFTTAELAKKLKMNVQVITRKVQAGEIMAYKIGKDWRIPDSSVEEWLQSKANRKSATRKTKAKAKAETQSPEREPASESSRTHLLQYLLAQFEPGKDYTQDEVEHVIGRHHDDAAALRQELVDCRMMQASDGLYHRRPSYQLSR